MHCHEVERLLVDLTDHELPTETARQVREHLRLCAGCQTRWNALCEVVEALEAFPMVVEPAHLTAQVMTRIVPRSGVARFRLSWTEFVGSAAGAGLFLGFLLGWQGLSSLVFPEELVSVLARAEVCLGLLALRLDLRLMLLGQDVAAATLNGWWLVLPMVVASALLVLAARERGALLSV